MKIMSFIMFGWGTLIAVDPRSNVNIKSLTLPKPPFRMPQEFLGNIVRAHGSTEFPQNHRTNIVDIKS